MPHRVEGLPKPTAGAGTGPDSYNGRGRSGLARRRADGLARSEIFKALRLIPTLADVEVFERGHGEREQRLKQGLP